MTATVAKSRKPKAAKPAAAEAAPAPAPKVLAFKGFDMNLTCRGHQFELGKTYEVGGKIKACENGFHACEYPLAVLNYYPAATSRYCVVELSGDMDVEEDKTAARKVTVVREITLQQLIHEAVTFTTSRAKPEGATASGYQGAATASGDQGAATASGYQGAATASGKYAAAMGSGYGSRARGAIGSALFLVERLDAWSDDNGKILHVWAGIVGEGGVKPDAYYTLRDGKPVEVAE